MVGPTEPYAAMSRTSLDSAEVKTMLLAVADAVIAAEPALSEADRNLGDGDHGLGMQRGFQAVQAKLASMDAAEGIDKLLSATGMAMMSSMGGASGAIFGTLFRDGGKALAGRTEFDGAALAGGKADAAAVKEAAEFLVLASAPMMPHLAEECWQAMGKAGHVVDTAWPKADPALLADDQVTIAVQVNGKRRDEITIPKDLDAKQVEALVLKLDAVARALEGRPVKKVIVVPGRIANIVG